MFNPSDSSAEDRFVLGLSEEMFRLHLWRKILKIEKFTEETNGRVTTLENWRWLMMGGLIVLSVLVIPVGIELMR